MFREYALFLQEFLLRRETTGAVLPSSDALARAITRPLAGHSAPVRVLEVGPGTGVFTRRIARLLRPGDELVLVEVSDRFVAHLAEQLAHDPVLKSVAAQVRLVHDRIERALLSEQFDFIISGLPMNNFPAEQVRLILRTFRRLAADGGVLSFFEYLWLRPLRLAVAWGPERGRLRGIAAAVAAWQRRYGIGQTVVLRNFPPALVRYWQFG